MESSKGSLIGRKKQNISCGLAFGDGAITSFRIENGVNSLNCVGETPKGLCGSGLIDVVAELLKKGMIDKDGVLKNDFEIAFGLKLLQSDVREFQLAKSAVRTGLEVLITEAKISFADVKKVYLAGGFSLEINIDNACISGLVPPLWQNITQAVGNTSLRGAIEFLKQPQKAKTIVEKTTVFTLGARQDFSEKFIKNLAF